MQRRQFLTGAAAAACPTLAAGAQGPPAQGLPAKAKITSSVMLWTLKGSFQERIESAARAGVQSVEFVAEHTGWNAADAERAMKLLRSFRLGVDTIIATPDWARRPVSMLDAAQRGNFLADVRTAIDWAKRLNVPYIILMSGNTIPGKSREDQWASLVESGKRAAELAGKGGVSLIIEPLNSLVNHKGYFLDTCVDGLKLVKQVDHPRFRLLFDIYHEQVQTGNVIRTLTEAAPHVAVFHVADNPGRNDPGTGELNWPNIYKAIQKTGYTGYVTMEYLPLGDQVKSLTRALNDFRAALMV
jgi:hydroxypyruvate isomerase